MVLSAATALGLGLLLAAPVPALQDEEPPRLGVELAAKGPGCAVTFEELDALLLVRHGRSPAGRDALDSLVQLRVVEALGEAEGVAVTTAELNARWRAFEDQVVQGGHAESLESYLAENQIQRSTFRQHLEIGLLHQKLARLALGLGPDDAITAEQQTTWLVGRIQELGRVDGEWPWKATPVARIGELVAIDRDAFALFLREQLPEDELRDAAYELLLEQRVLAKLPDLSDEALARAERARPRSSSRPAT